MAGLSRLGFTGATLHPPCRGPAVPIGVKNRRDQPFAALSGGGGPTTRRSGVRAIRWWSRALCLSAVSRGGAAAVDVGARVDLRACGVAQLCGVLVVVPDVEVLVPEAV